MRAIIVSIGLICGSAFAVYPSFVQLDMIDQVRHRVVRDLSEEEYRQAIDGRAPFPYQWRMLGPAIVRAGEIALRVDPHAIDIVVRVAALAVSALALGLFAVRVGGTAVGTASIGFYFAATAAAYASQPYSIYYTSDFLMIAAWFWVVQALDTDRVALATAATFVGAFAKETLLLAPMLAGIRWLRTQRDAGRLIAVSAAFLVPTILLRLTYRAPIASWAWWDAARNNVPFLDPARVGWTIRYNVKVLAFYNVGWAIAAVAAWRSRDPFVRDLAVALAIYLVLAYIVVYIRELRHFLPLAILIIPLTLKELIS